MQNCAPLSLYKHFNLAQSMSPIVFNFNIFPAGNFTNIYTIATSIGIPVQSF